MTGLTIKKLKKENGAVSVVESSIVFPVMFIILLFLIYMGNAHYIKAQIESVVVENAIEGAAYCADPVLESIKKDGKVPGVKEIEAEPYRYIFGGMDKVERKISQQVVDEIEGSTGTFFGNMKPKLKTSKSEIAKFNNYILFSTFSVDVEYEIRFPIRFLGVSDFNVLKIRSHSEIAVSDATEFIRNTDMVIDYFQDTKFGKSISGAFEKINEFITKFANS